MGALNTENNSLFTRVFELYQSYHIRYVLATVGFTKIKKVIWYYQPSW